MDSPHFGDVKGKIINRILHRVVYGLPRDPADASDESPPRKSHKPHSFGDPFATFWYKQYVRLENKDWADPMTRKGKLFRRRFRVSYDFFLQLVADVRRRGWYSEGADATGKAGAPLEVKILAVLRVLGRGVVFDEVAEHTGMGEESLRVFFISFVRHYAEEVLPEVLAYPRCKEDLDELTREYTMAGFPGAIGSIDCTRIHWECCPYGLRLLHMGKKGIPERSYEFVVDHKGRIMHCTRGFRGCVNDKLVAQCDKFVDELQGSPLFTEYEFDMMDSEGAWYKCKGAYLISDNGYQKVRYFQEPMKYPCFKDERRWSEWCESLRKDVEMVFGRLKKRYRLCRARLSHIPAPLKYFPR